MDGSRIWGGDTGIGGKRGGGEIGRKISEMVDGDRAEDMGTW